MYIIKSKASRLIPDFDFLGLFGGKMVVATIQSPKDLYDLKPNEKELAH